MGSMWIYILAPLLGAILAGLFHWWITNVTQRFRETGEESKRHGSKTSRQILNTTEGEDVIMTQNNLKTQEYQGSNILLTDMTNRVFNDSDMNPGS